MKTWLMGRVHVSLLITGFFLGIIVGLVLCIATPAYIFSSFLFAIAAVTFLSLAVSRPRRAAICLAILSGLLLGLWRGSNAEIAVEAYSPLYGKQVQVIGEVSEDTALGKRGEQQLKLHVAKVNGRSVDGELWLSTQQSAKIFRSDTITVTGMLDEGFGGFSATIFRAEINKIERTSTQDVGLHARDVFAGQVSKVLGEPERSLGLGFLLGLRNILPELLEKQIQIVGLTHVVVASGYNLTILVTFARRLFARISKYLAALCGGGMIAGFMMITGLSPSMSRAGLVAGLGLATWYYGRKIHPIPLLIIAAAITLLIRPSYIWGDVGWHLSFSAFFGILVLAPLLNHYFWGVDSRPSWLREIVVATLSAQITTLPILLKTFGVYSVYALPANVLVLPAVPLAMLATFIAGATAAIPLVGNVLSLPALILLKYCIFIIQKFASLPYAQGELTISSTGVVVGYAVILVIVLFLLHKTKHNFLKDRSTID